MQPNTVYRNEFPDNEDDQNHGSIIFVAVKSYFSTTKRSTTSTSTTSFLLIVSIIPG